MSKTLIFNDRLMPKDAIGHSGFWAKTQIIGGYNFYKDDKGISQLGEVVFETTNMVPLAGVQFAFEQIFGVSHQNLKIPTLHERDISIGSADNQHSTARLITNDIPVSQSDIKNAYGDNFPHPHGEHVCLFGVGCDGNNENNISVKEVKYVDYLLDGMVPFRHVVTSGDGLTDAERKVYFGKCNIINNYNSYLLKKIDTAEIKHIIKNSDGTEINGSEGSPNNPYDTSFLFNDGIESYLEAKLIIDKKDVREWFNYNGNIEMTRINSIGLFSAYYDSVNQEYANVRLFSKLNIPNEPLSLTKNMTILYRVYGA